MNKKTTKEIKQIANTLLPSFYEANTKVFVSGQELLDQGETEWHRKPIEKDKKYLAVKKTAHKVNHFRQLKNLYESKGVNGLVEYVKMQGEIHGVKPPINLHSRLI